MSWKDIIKADNVGLYGYYYLDEDGNEMLDKPTPKGLFDTEETWVNLTKVKDLEDFIETDLHETIHQATIAEIDNEIKEFLTEETRYLQDSPELYTVKDGTVRPKRQLFDSLKQKIGQKLASHVAFTEIVTLLQTDSTNLNSLEEVKDAYTSSELYAGYAPQFINDIETTHYRWIYRNLIAGASNALKTDKKWYDITTERDRKRHEILKDRFITEIGQMAARVLVDTLAINEDWDKTIDFNEGRTETIAEAKKRLEESKLNKSWESILKNIQISSQRTSSKDYVNPDKDDVECCDLLAKFIDEATSFRETNRFGNGMVGVPTFYDTGGMVPDDDFVEMIYDSRDKHDMWKDFMDLLNRADDVEKEFERLQKLYADSVKHVLFHRDTCENIVTNLDKWSDRNFVGWKFYEEWVYPYTSSLSTQAKNLVDRDYERYMDSYRKIWIALLQNNCADILIQKSWMRMANQG